jgi:hypothetical protein
MTATMATYRLNILAQCSKISCDCMFCFERVIWRILSEEEEVVRRVWKGTWLNSSEWMVFWGLPSLFPIWGLVPLKSDGWIITT